MKEPAIVLVLLSVGLAGCGSSLESSLTGTLTYQGKPVPYAQLMFENQETGPSAYTMADEKGHFYMRTGSQRGLAPGNYRVAVQPPGDFSIPEKYGSVRTSGIEVKVAPGENHVDIKMD